MKLLFRLISTISLVGIIFCAIAISSLHSQTNLLPNGGLEIAEPNYWNKLNEGDGSSIMTWDMVNGNEGSRALKIEKPNTSAAVVGWKSDDNSYLYWNHAEADRLYNLSFKAKTEGVNTDPATDDAKIGVLYAFYAGGTLLGEQFVEVDQTTAGVDWTEYTNGLLIPAGDTPDELYITIQMGKDATGTVLFDDVGCGCDPWAMGVFNGNMEVPVGWMEWHAGGGGFANTVQDSVHSGDWSAMMYEWDDNDDEMVFYSEPVVADPNTWYRISVWAKGDSITSDEKYLPTAITTDRDNNRLGMCFFFHKAPITKTWDLTGGDQYFYFDQRATSGDWTEYSVVVKSPEDAAGVSCRARFTSYPVGRVWYDDFSIEKLEVEPNILVNGDLETAEPNYWNKLNEGDGSSVMTWDMVNGNEGSRALKVEKPNSSTAVVGWKSDDNSYLYWNHAEADRLYNLSFKAKTEGVNTDPATDDAKIGVLYAFYAGGTLLGEQFVEVDQTTAGVDWTEYTNGLLIPAGDTPDELYITIQMGKDATGTVLFDDVGCGCDPWAMGVFNGNMEVPVGWMEWHAGGGGFANTVQDSVHSGDWSTMMYEWDDNDDEMVFYSEPAPAEPNKWYKLSVWAKADSINTDESYLPSNITPDRDNNRLGMCFFFHKAPIDKTWDLTGGDQYFYFDQRATSGDWTEYNVIVKSPEDAAGVSCRARFTSYPVGRVWYDDFSIQPLNVEQIPTGISDPSNYAKIQMPEEFKIAKNYPNPFNPTTTIEYSVPKDGKIQIAVYNVLGCKVRTLLHGFRNAGNHQIQWDGKNDAGSTLASGVYLVTLRSGNFVTAKRMSLIK